MLKILRFRSPEFAKLCNSLFYFLTRVTFPSLRTVSYVHGTFLINCNCLMEIVQFNRAVAGTKKLKKHRIFELWVRKVFVPHPWENTEETLFSRNSIIRVLLRSWRFESRKFRRKIPAVTTHTDHWNCGSACNAYCIKRKEDRVYLRYYYFRRHLFKYRIK